jgi:hypothetical protein
VELFEQGRTIMFSRTLDARSDLTDLLQAHPDLAERFMRSRDVLDRPEMVSSHAEIDPEAALLVEIEGRRVAAAQFEQVVSVIRCQPGFERFLAPRTITELLLAAEDGPVVLLNVDELRSDALVLSPDSVEVISLPEVDPSTVLNKAKELLAALAEIHSATTPAAVAAADKDLAIILEWIGESITGPVLDYLRFTSKRPDDGTWPRLWWCPSGALSFLPLHAAGHHDLTDLKFGDAVIDRAVTSTISGLRALIEARAKPIIQNPRVLVVAMPTTPDHADLPGASGEAAAIQRLYREKAQSLGVIDAEPATCEAVAAALPDYAWVHFACHGSSDLDNPSDSHLLLADGPLSVTDMTHMRLDGADLAFLSACTTFRSGTRLLDEPIHLAAACQLAGFSHVIASLWPISDRDTERLTWRFYTTVTSVAEANSPAAALHHAVRDLRDARRNYPHRWAPYLHTGP